MYMAFVYMYFTKLPVTERYTASNDWIKINSKYTERSGRGLIKTLSWYSLERLRKPTKNIWLVGVFAEIQTRHFSNTSQKDYRMQGHKPKTTIRILFSYSLQCTSEK
jgi:hypothetical protein